MGGSADLAPSTNTWLNDSAAFAGLGSGSGREAEQGDCYEGRNIHFGVREHAMGSIVNGMSFHGGVIPYGATFLVFSDYMRPAIRLSALSHLGSIWVFTHDSIGLGEDGPTHQPVEHLAALRAIPNLVTIRPADANEVRFAWISAIQNRARPTAIVLSRQNLPTLDRQIYAPAAGLLRGAYVLADLGAGEPQIILMASGSEVGLIVAAGERLAKDGIPVRLVSFPSWELFAGQDKIYRDAVLPPRIDLRLAVEAGVSQGWDSWVGSEGSIHALDRFGASAPGSQVFENLGFSADQIEQAARILLNRGLI